MKNGAAKRRKFFLLICISSLSINESIAQPGLLDPTFGTGGQVTLVPVSGQWSRAKSVTTQSDGKIVVAGYSGNNSANGDDDFTLCRYLATGTLDNSFSGDGKLMTNFSSEDDQINKVIVQSDGMILAGGYSNNNNTSYFTMARYSTTGTSDLTFGTNGKVVSDSGEINDMYLQSDGKILTAGTQIIWTGSNWLYLIRMVRYNSDGSVDSAFGTQGRVKKTINGFNCYATSITCQSDGKIVLGGYTSDSNGNNTDFLLLRYNSDGSPDNSFDLDGMVQSDFSGADDKCHSIQVQPDGKMLACGSSYSGTGNVSIVLARFAADGSPDSGFGIAGVSSNPFGMPLDMILQNDGKILVTGTTTDNSSLILGRYLADGNFDPTFLNGGLVHTAFGLSTYNIGFSVALQSDGKILVAGESSNHFALARYGNDVAGIKELNSINSHLLVLTDPLSYVTRLQIVSAQDNTPRHLIIYNETGQVVMEKKVSAQPEIIELNVQTGLYFYELRQADQRVLTSGKVMVCGK